MLQNKTPDVHIFALGGNLSLGGKLPVDVVHEGMAALREVLGGDKWLFSAIYRTPAFPAGSGSDFANAVALCRAPVVAAEAALAGAHGVETAFGRARQARWGARTLDIDLIAAGPGGGQICPDAATVAAWRALPPDAQAQAVPQELILPHPRILDRSFVLVPLVEVAPDWVDPVSGLTARALLAARPAEERATVVLWQRA